MKKPSVGFIAISSAIALHGIFTIQAIFAAPAGGMIQNGFFAFLFYPHALLVYFLPPNYPISIGMAGEVTVDWIRFSGRILDAVPASLIYGFCAALFYALITHKKEKP